MKVSIITVSDRGFGGQYEDLSGPEIEKEVKRRFADAVVSRRIVPDEPRRILAALKAVTGERKIRTPDLGGNSTTEEFTAAVVARIRTSV